jgi:ribosomal protein S28E/S33
MKTLAILTIAALLTGCTDKALQERVSVLEKDLGDFRFARRAPQIVAKVLAIEVENPEKDYLRPEVKITGILKQKGEFPLARYWAQIHVDVMADGQRIGEAVLGAAKVGDIMVGGECAFTATARADDYPSGKKLDRGSVTLKLKHFSWGPSPDLTGSATLEVVER